MSLFLPILTALSISFSLLKKRFEYVGAWLTLVVLSFFLIDCVLLYFNASLFIKTFNYPILVTVIFFEAALAWFLGDNRDEVNAVIPQYTMPLLTLTTFGLIDVYATVENISFIFCMMLLLQFLWAGSETNKSYYNKKLLLNFLVFILTLTFLALNSSGLDVLMLVFLYWYSLDIFPLGLDKDSSQDESYPIVNRVFLFSLLILNFRFEIHFIHYLIAAIFIGFGAIVSILSFTKTKNSWVVFKKSIQALFLLVGLTSTSVISYGLFLALINVSIVTYLVKVILSLNVSHTIKKTILVFSMLFGSGLILGRPTQIIKEVVRWSSLEGVGPTIIFILLPLWLVNSVYYFKISKDIGLEESKIDHLQAVFFLSAIMISILISL